MTYMEFLADGSLADAAAFRDAESPGSTLDELLGREIPPPRFRPGELAAGPSGAAYRVVRFLERTQTYEAEDVEGRRAAFDRFGFEKEFRREKTWQGKAYDPGIHDTIKA